MVFLFISQIKGWTIKVLLSLWQHTYANLMQTIKYNVAATYS